MNYDSWTDEDVNLQTYFSEIGNSQPLSREKEAELAERIAELDKHKDKPVILVCKMGTSASLAGRQLRARGFTRVARMQGGIQGWRADNLPVVKA